MLRFLRSGDTHILFARYALRTGSWSSASCRWS